MLKLIYKQRLLDKMHKLRLPPPMKGVGLLRRRLKEKDVLISTAPGGGKKLKLHGAGMLKLLHGAGMLMLLHGAGMLMLKG